MRASSSASPDAVFALLADVSTWALEPPRRLEYELVSGLPIRDYRAEVTLTPSAGGTEIRWHSRFNAKLPGSGGLARRALQRFIEQTAEGLAREAERGEPSKAEPSSSG